MSSEPQRRAEIIEGLQRAFRRYGVEVGMFNEAVALRLGINRTDLDVLAMLLPAGSLTAGQIGEGTRLTSGAVTGVIDRLEKAGYARRERDPSDRRRVIVRPVPEQAARVSALYQPMLRATEVALAPYDDAALALVARFIEQGREVLHRELLRLTGEEADAGTEPEAAAPLGGRTGARLEITGGATRLRLHAGGASGDLFRARFQGRRPALRVTADGLAIAAPRLSPDERRRHDGEVELNPTIPWEVEVRGGATELTADLSGIRLRGLTASGGVDGMRLSLPAPSGHGTIRIAGGATRVTIDRPRGTPARLRVEGTGAKLTLDGRRVGDAGSAARLESPGFDRAVARWDVEVIGGARELAVATRPGKARSSRA